jgi:putative phage-type endonuclease
MTIALVQGSDEWKAARLGRVTASRVADICTKTKTGGHSTSRANYAAELICERLTGVAAEGFTNAAMAWGTEKEPEARALYQFRTDADVTEVGFVPHPEIAMSGASPDGMVGDVGLIEIKCPLTATHIETLIGGSIPGKYETQMLWQMACTGRAWTDYVSYDPRLPGDMRLFVKRLHRDDARVAELEAEVRTFLAELDAKIAQLQAAVRRAA